MSALDLSPMSWGTIAWLRPKCQIPGKRSLSQRQLPWIRHPYSTENRNSTGSTSENRCFLSKTYPPGSQTYLKVNCPVVVCLIYPQMIQWQNGAWSLSKCSQLIVIWKFYPNDTFGLLLSDMGIGAVNFHGVKSFFSTCPHPLAPWYKKAIFLSYYCHMLVRVFFFFFHFCFGDHTLFST